MQVSVVDRHRDGSDPVAGRGDERVSGHGAGRTVIVVPARTLTTGVVGSDGGQTRRSAIWFQRAGSLLDDELERHPADEEHQQVVNAKNREPGDFVARRHGRSSQFRSREDDWHDERDEQDRQQRLL